MIDHFKQINGTTLPLPLFFPDATRAVVKAVDNEDVVNTGTQGVLVNTYHLWRLIPERKMREIGGVRNFMNWKGGIISDSGGFQAMSLIKKGGGKITDEGLWFKPPNAPRVLMTPEESVRYQLAMGTDLCVVLDEYTHEGSTAREARESVERTIAWAKRSRIAFDQTCEEWEIPKDQRPYLIAVNQGGKNVELRRECNERLVEIGFDGYGHGGDGFDEERKLDMALSQIVVDSAPKNSLFYGLGVGKPEDVVRLARQGYQVFDCVIPTRDARHDRLYFWKDGVQVETNDFYVTKRAKTTPKETYCDCHTCRNYSWEYVAHLFSLGETLSYRLMTIHNLRFYATMIEELRYTLPNQIS